MITPSATKTRDGGRRQNTWARALTLLAAVMPLVAFPLLSVVLCSSVFAAPRWLFMWSLAVSIYAGLKWLTFAEAQRGASTLTTETIPLSRKLAYLFLWCGMNARSFLRGPTNKQTRPALSEWTWASLKIGLGFGLIYLAVPALQSVHWLAVGWVGMGGIAFLLHFGVLHVISLFWQARGYAAPPIMNKPHHSASLAEFWGKRWNTAFRDLAHRYIFRPLAPRRGVLFATMAVFVASAIVHEVVISPSARGGYGLTSLYFLLQGAALLVERSRLGKTLGLGAGLRGRMYCLAIIVAPAVICFPPVFIRNVTLPLLNAIGAM